VGFEPTIPAIERAKTVRALDRAATVIGFAVDIATTNKQGTYLLKEDESTLLQYEG
jgi:hypothetical protein